MLFFISKSDVNFAQYLEFEAAAVNVAFDRQEWTSGEVMAPQQTNR
jgi:hypothetical protein